MLEKNKDFIKKNGLPKKILTYIGKEFKNNSFKKYCKRNDIIYINGLPRHPQTQSVVERYNRTIKELLHNIYTDYQLKSKFFSIELELENAIKIYNNKKHSSTGYAPVKICNSKDPNLFDTVKKNIIDSQKYNNKNVNLYIENKLALLCKNLNF